MRVGQPDLIRTNHFPGSAGRRLTQHLPEMITILQDWAQCLMPLLQEAVISSVREDRTGTEGCYSPSECSSAGSHSTLLLINLTICHSSSQGSKNKLILLRREITGDSSKQIRKLGGKESDLEKVVHRCFSGVDASTWEQPSKEPCRATEGAIVPLCYWCKPWWGSFPSQI